MHLNYKIPLLLILFIQKLGFYNKGWRASLFLCTKTIRFSIHRFSSLSLSLSLTDWIMFNQVENPILAPCPPKPPSPFIDLTCATQSNKKHKLTSIVWNDFEKKTIDGVPWAICNHCNRKLKPTSLYITTHLHNHLQGYVWKRIMVILEIYLIKRKF